MCKKTLFFLMLIDMYGVLFNFYNYIKTLNTRISSSIKQEIFNNTASAIGIVTKDGKWTSYYDYEKASVVYLVYLYIRYKLGISRVYIYTRQTLIDCLNTVEGSKYCIGTFYHNGSKEEIIVPSLNKENDSNNVKTAIAYALMGDVDITMALKMYQKSLANMSITTNEFAEILIQRGYVNINVDDLEKITLTIMDLSTMEEQIFKANDLITI